MCANTFGFDNADGVFWLIKGKLINPDYTTTTAVRCKFRYRTTAGPGAWSAWGGFEEATADTTHPGSVSPVHQLPAMSAFSTQYDIQVQLDDGLGTIEYEPNCLLSVFRVTTGSGVGVDGSYDGVYPTT